MSSLKSRFKRNVLYQGSAEGDKKIDENREIFIDSIDSPSPLKILSLNIKIVDLIVHLQLACIDHLHIVFSPEFCISHRLQCSIIDLITA